MANRACLCICADGLATRAGDDHGEWNIGKRRRVVRYRRDDRFFNAARRDNAEDRIGAKRRRCNGSTPPSCAVSGTTVRVSFSVASLSYVVGAGNGPQRGNPVSPLAVSVEQNSAPFLNTTVRFLQAFNYFYDAANGFIGLKTTGNTPAQYAANTPSGLTVAGVFQCFFSSVPANFGSSWSGLQQPTKYSWPYTYRYDPNLHGLRPNPVYIGISSGAPSSAATPAEDANGVYIENASGQFTKQGDLSGWLSAAGCQ